MSAPLPTSYQRIKTEILRRIHSREWPPGALIPGEIELAVEFGCARTTMNRALRELAEAGVVARKRRAGTRVVSSPVRRAQLEIPIVRHEVEASGAAYRYSLLSREQLAAPEAVRARLDLPEGAAMLHVRCLHLADERPWQYEDRWISIAAVPAIADAPLHEISANEWLVREAPYSEGEITLSAALAEPGEAELLAVPAASPVFVIERKTWLLGAPVTAVRMVHPATYRITTPI